MTPFYASIEQILQEPAHPAFDVWAIGITLYTLMAKVEPFPITAVGKRILAIKSNQREKLSEEYS